MRTTTITATAVTILLGAAIALAAPAAANQANAPTERVNHDQISLRRDGDRAVPFDPVATGKDRTIDTVRAYIAMY